MSTKNQFPGHRDPQRVDNVRASAPLPPEFLRTFKLALPSKGGSYFAGPENPDNQTSSENQRQEQLHYPISMFSSLPELPPPPVLEALLELFSQRFRAHAPFLRDVHLVAKPSSQQEKRAPFVVYAMATIGALAADDDQLKKRGPNLWQITSRVHSAACELDNRMARRVDWVLSFAILAVYGIMNADALLWSETNIWNGHADTAAKRIGLNNIRSRTNKTQAQSGEGTNWRPDSRMRENAKIMSFYFMIDLLRAITLNTATSFQASDMQIPSSNGVPLDKVYEHLVLDSEPLTQDLSPDDYLLILLMIIAETLQLQRRLGPLIDWDSICHAEKAPTDLGRKGEEYDTTGSTFVYSNPYVPNSASGEYLRISHLLSAALTLWTSACMEMVSGKLSPRKGESRAAPRVDPSTLLLVYFCRLLLAGGSHILSLIPMVGFCARGNFKVPQHLDPADIPVINDDALRLAWLILDNIEPKLPDDSPKWYALWCPIVCFTAALTVWASLQTKWSAKGTDHMGLAGSKTLRLFEFELRDMPWPCSAVMADILAELRVR